MTTPTPEQVTKLVERLNKELDDPLWTGDALVVFRQSVRDARNALTALLAALQESEADVRWIHQKLKRGEATQDHGLRGNLCCIIDHLADAAIAKEQKP